MKKSMFLFGILIAGNLSASNYDIVNNGNDNLKLNKLNKELTILKIERDKIVSDEFVDINKNVQTKDLLLMNKIDKIEKEIVLIENNLEFENENKNKIKEQEKLKTYKEKSDEEYKKLIVDKDLKFSVLEEKERETLKNTISEKMYEKDEVFVTFD